MQNGFGIVYSNRLENLADALIQWCAKTPLPSPLVEEVVLVQSNGMADWLKLRQADATGISANTRYPMPASFLWELYQHVLEPEQLLKISPYKKNSLQWRIFSLLPNLLSQPGFERPRQYLLNEDKLDVARHFQLSRRLADLFDQYQLYRSDWLLNWEQGQNAEPQQGFSNEAFKADEAWQKALWQALVKDIGSNYQSRAVLHQKFLQGLNKADKATLPQRIILFGINSLPAQLLEALYALSQHCQIMMFVLTPSQEFWEDKYNGGHPLLDAWGARGRDFIRLLREEYERQGSANQLKLQEAELYGELEQTSDSLPKQIQQSLLQNQSPPSWPQPLPVPLQQTPGLTFHPAYSRQREVEVLHDKILGLLAKDHSLSYRDFIVMMPNIEHYVPHVDAVFGRQKAPLEYAISDRNVLTESTLFQALNYLLALPQSRLTFSEVFTLLEQPAVRRRFNIQAKEVEQLQRWAEQGQIRWGFNKAHKAQVLTASDAPDAWENNTWQQGFDRLLAGYCAGDAAVWGQADTPMIDHLALNEVTANQGELLGRFYQLLNLLQQWQQGPRLNQPHPPQANEQANTESWQSIFSALLEQFFSASDDDEKNLMDALQRALGSWLDDCQAAAFNQALPLAQARIAWLDKIEQAGLSQKLHFNGIVFCTLMPMRALPFKHVFLLGMNDGDYPREQISPDFDLMQHHYLAGDRDRRGDDQYLFLEALMSARQSLTISWVGKSIVDGSTKEPSVLVNQLRDYLALCFENTESLTYSSPLTPFSRSYFEKGSSHRTYAQDWLGLYKNKAIVNNELLSFSNAIDNINFNQLARLLKNPVEVFFRDGLGVAFTDLEDNSEEDDEPFTLTNLSKWQLRSVFLESEQSPASFAMLKRAGTLPIGGFANQYINQAENEANNIRSRIQLLTEGAMPIEPKHSIALSLNASGLSTKLVGQLGQLWQGNGCFQLYSSASNIGTASQPRFDKVALAWVTHLAACASGLSLTTYLVGLSGTLSFTPVSQSGALSELNLLLELYWQALQQPLPVPPMAASQFMHASFLAKEDANQESLEKAAMQGFYNDRGLCDLDNLYIKRAFSRFEQVWQNDGSRFMAYANQLYLPILTALKATQANHHE
ncbi:MAG: exodeoxyribonuclease V subunit gamma [Venatoribacter sp.]